MRWPNSRIYWWSGVMMTVVVAACNGGTASAQMLPPGFDEALQPDFTRADTLLMGQELQLTEAQATVVQDLQAEYDAAFKAGVKQIQSKLRERVPEVTDQDTPELKRKREELQRQIGELMEEARKLQSSPAEGEGAAAAAEEIKRKTQELNEQIKALEASSMSAAQLQATFEAAAMEVELWQVEKKRLAQKFVTDVRTVLDEPQQAKWPAFERRLIRERTIGRGKLSGESVNLFALLREVDLDDATSASLEQLLDDYSVRLDTALRARNEFSISSQKALMQAVHARSAELAGPIFRRQIELRTAVRDVNEQYAEIIASRLPEPAQAEFRKLYGQRGFPTVYRSTATQRDFKRSLELTQSDAPLQNAIRELETAYLAELAPMNDQFRQALRSHEPHELVLQSEARLLGENGQLGAATNRLADVRVRRQELDRRYRQQLLAMLPAELASQIAGVSHPQSEP